MSETNWAGLLGRLPGVPAAADLAVTFYCWPFDPRTTPGEAWADLIHDATWEGE